MTEQPFALSLSGPGLELARSVSQEMALRVLNVVMGSPASSAVGVPPQTTEAEPPSDPTQTIGEFLAGLQIGNNADRLAGIALYLREHLGKGRIAKDELPVWFERAGESPPKNLSRDLRQAISKRLVAEDHAHPGQYFVTATGEARVSNGASVTSGRSARRSGASKPRVDELPKPSSSQDASSGQRQRRRGKSTGQNPMDLLRQLIGQGWFSSPRPMTETIDELARRGTHLKGSGLTRQMQMLVKDGDLRREKATPEGTSRAVWHYSVP